MVRLAEPVQDPNNGTSTHEESDAEQSRVRLGFERRSPQLPAGSLFIRRRNAEKSGTFMCVCDLSDSQRCLRRQHYEPVAVVALNDVPDLCNVFDDADD